MKDLETKRTKIRKFKMTDAEDIYNSIATIRKLEDCYNYHLHKNVEETRLIISSAIKEYELGEAVWAIEEKKTGKAIGYIRAVEISRENSICNLNFGIGLKWIEEGLLEEALQEVMDYLIYDEGLSIIISKFYDSNDWIRKTKTKVLKNIGMKQEAILRNRKINNKTGKTENLIIFSITKEEMQKRMVS